MFGYIDGRWIWLGGNGLQANSGGRQQATNGPGGQLMLGYKFASNWDVSLAGDIQQLFTDVTQFRGGTLAIDTTHQHVDLEVGYSENWWRLSGGLRGIHYLQRANYYGPGFVGYDLREMYGIGPMVGGGALFPISSDWAVIADADVAFVYTSYADTGNGMLMNNGSYSQFVPQFDAEVGVAWHTQGALSVTIGPRIATSFNTAIAVDGSHQGTLLEFGPFIRVSYNFGGRVRMHASPVAATEAPIAIATTHQVFFGFDDSDISPVASGAIEQAASDARRGRPATIQMTGPGEGVGDPTYNLALSRRRANAVRDELARHGVSLEQIVVVDRRECEPLIATAAGSRDPKSVRVQIAY